MHRGVGKDGGRVRGVALPRRQRRRVAAMHEIRGQDIVGHAIAEKSIIEQFMMKSARAEKDKAAIPYDTMSFDDGSVS